MSRIPITKPLSNVAFLQRSANSWNDIPWILAHNDRHSEVAFLVDMRKWQLDELELFVLLAQTYRVGADVCVDDREVHDLPPG